MLVLTRHTSESIIIGENAEMAVTVLAIKGNQVQIGIKAPKTIPVHRTEIYERIKSEREGQEEQK